MNAARGSPLIADGALTVSHHAVFRSLTELASGGRIAVFGIASSEPARVAALAAAQQCSNTSFKSARAAGV